jgi:hypothetical protein
MAATGTTSNTKFHTGHSFQKFKRGYKPHTLTQARSHAYGHTDGALATHAFLFSY